jgi:SSS family solute:Na+ symporter
MIVFVFTFVPLFLAEIARKKALPTLFDFFLQNRKMSLLMVFFTVYTTWMSIFAFLGAGGYFYSRGPVYMSTIAWDALFGLLFFVLGERIWAYGKLNGYITPRDFFDDIFGSKLLNAVMTFVMLVFTMIYLQIQFSGGAFVIEIASGGRIPWQMSGLVFYLVIIIYLWAGGIRAVALADIFYGILMFASMVFIGFFLISRSGGITATFEEIILINELHVILPGPDGDAGELLWICMFITVPIGAIMGPQIWVRMYAVGNRKTFSIMPLFLCLIAIQCFGMVFAGSASILLKDGILEPDRVIPLVLLEHAGPVLCTILFCGIASAALSTANSQIHASAAIYTVDIHKRYFNPNASEKQLVMVAKWAVLGFSIIAYLFLIRSPSIIIETGTMALGGTAQVIVPTLGALFWERSHPKAASTGLTAGIATLLFLFVFSAMSPVYSTIIALAINCGLFVFLSLFFEQDLKTYNKISGYKEAYKNRRI